MTLFLCRAARTEELAFALAAHLRERRPDPFEAVPIVVGSRGMERWLRHRIATELGVAAQLAFPFPRQAIDGATAALLGRSTPGGGPWWEHRAAGHWGPEALAFRLVGLLRERAVEPTFEAVARYLGAEPGGAVAYRELAFAREVADVLDRLMHERPRAALAWARDPESAREHRWLAELLAAVGATDDGSPAALHVALVDGPGPAAAPPLAPLSIFGLSTIGPGDRERLAAIARHVDVHLYLLAPSEEWWADVRGKREQRAALLDAQKKGDPAEIERLEQEIASQNAVLASLGLPSRDLQVWLEQSRYQEDERPCAAADAATALGALQGWVRRAGAMPTAGGAPLLPRDASVGFHAAWGPLRQVEVLRDELLALMAGDARVEPRDVLVMTPDVETYAPLVAAVFARSGAGGPAGPPAIPVAIADLGLARTNPVAEVLLAVLALAEERVTAPRLFELLALEPVRQRFGLDADDVADLRELIATSGMRWGLDAADRAAVGQPALDQNTLGFGLERLALGALMPDEDPTDAVDGTGELLPIAPVELESRARAARVGALGQLVRAVGDVRRRARPQPLPQWRDLLRDVAAGFARTSDGAAWLGAQVEEELDGLVEAAADLGEAPLGVGALRRLLASRFEVPRRGDRPITGAVTVCALQPMRSVPFRVIALLGMDDGAFPRGATPRAWDPFARALPGERDPRTVERHLLLETLLCARDRLLILWSGFDVRTGEPLPAAVPVEELLEVVGRLSGAGRDDLVRRHPLQPWSLDVFAPGGAGPWDPALAAAAARLLAVTAGRAEPEPVGLAASFGEDVPPEDHPPRDVSLDELADGLAAPQRLFLAGRMGLYPPEGGAALPDREPIELDGLGAWDIRQRALEALRAGGDPQEAARRVLRRAAAEGALPLQAGGERVVLDATEEAQALLEAYGAAAGAPVEPPTLTVDLPCGLQVRGRAPAARQHGGRLLLEWLVPGKSDRAKLQLRAWVYTLAARAQGLDAAARVVGADDGARSRIAGQVVASDRDAAWALAALDDLGALWLACRARPTPLFPRTSRAIADAWPEHGDDALRPDELAAVERAVRAAWSSDDGEQRDRWVAPLFGPLDPADALGTDRTPAPGSVPGLALRLWAPLLEALAAGRALAKAWPTEPGEAP